MRAWIVFVGVVVAGGSASGDAKYDPFEYMHGPPPQALVHAPAPVVVPDAKTVHRVAVMMDVHGAFGGLVSDRGDHQVFDEGGRVFRQDGPMKLAVQLTAGDEAARVEALSPDEKWLVVSRGGGLYVMPVEGGALRLVAENARLAFVADDATAVYFAVRDAVVRWDVADGKATVAFEANGAWRVADHRGDAWLMVKTLGPGHDEVYEYTVATKALVPLLGQGAAQQYDVAYGAKPGQVIVQTKGLSVLEHGALKPIAGDEIERFVIDPARTRIYTESHARVGVIDARTFAAVALPKLPVADSVRLAGVSRNGRFVELTLDGARMAPVTLTWDWSARRLDTWRVPVTPEIDVRTFAVAALESFPVRDGAQVAMVVRRPAACDEPCPVVVMLRGDASPGFDAYAQTFVDAGFVVVQPKLRGVATDADDAARYVRSTWSKDGRTPKVGVLAEAPVAGAFDAVVAQPASTVNAVAQAIAVFERTLR
jgi:dipeptidyl aminopeptidase/acylaminoacyl peptidase